MILIDLNIITLNVSIINNNQQSKMEMMKLFSEIIIIKYYNFIFYLLHIKVNWIEKKNIKLK